MPGAEGLDDQFNLEFFIKQGGLQEECHRSGRQRPVAEMRAGHKKSGRGSISQKQKQSSHIKQSRRTGHWITLENKRYHWFLQIYHKHFMNKQLRRIDRIFKIMENFLESREAEQCRSHHQKMEKRHGNFVKILLHLRKQHYNLESIDSMREEMLEHGVNTIDGILSCEQLNNCINKKQNTEQADIQAGNLEDQLSCLKEESKHVQNLLNDNYEDRIQFRDFMNP